MPAKLKAEHWICPTCAQNERAELRCEKCHRRIGPVLEMTLSRLRPLMGEITAIRAHFHAEHTLTEGETARFDSLLQQMHTLLTAKGTEKP